MKNITEYINEALEIEDSTSSYRIVTLLRHENIKCGKLTEEEFCELIEADLKEAAKIYADARKPEKEAASKAYMELRRKQLTEYAEKKWKTEKKRNEYIENAMANLNASRSLYDDKLDFVDFDVEPWENGIHGTCILHPSKIKAEAPRCFADIKDNKYFKRATGWAIKYEANKDSLRSCFRPYIDLLGDESLKKEMAEDRKRLADAITSFYANTNYWGD